MKMLRLTLLLLLGSCAFASSESENQDTHSPDASIKGFLDARPSPDAQPLPDAQTVSVPDAAPIVTTPDAAGLFCESSSACTESGTCCFSLGGPGFCVPGVEVLGACIPQ